LVYIFRQICVRILNVPVEFTAQAEDFIAYDGLKFSYTKQPLGNELFVKCHELLFDRGISDIEIYVDDWGGSPCFFPVGEKSLLPFDIFAASFYLLSRYEEYLPHVKDEFGRFQVGDSVAGKNNFLEIPVVDIWARKFKEVLQAKYPEISDAGSKFKAICILDVPEAYVYRCKGVVRNLIEISKNIYQLKFNHLWRRMLVLLRLRNDPYNIYDWILREHEKYPVEIRFFFLLSDISSYDKNLSINEPKFRLLIKDLADKASVGLKISFLAQNDAYKMRKEKERLENIIHRKTDRVRQSFTKLNLPETYRKLIELEIYEDYTMGYATHLGFRAGTSFPFYFYDLGYEIQTPLKVFPSCALDAALRKIENISERNQKLTSLLDIVKANHGTFITVFHNYTFSQMDSWRGWRATYIKLLKQLCS